MNESENRYNGIFDESKDVLFYVGVSKKQGLGHLVRSSVLMRAFQLKGFRISTVFDEPTDFPFEEELEKRIEIDYLSLYSDKSDFEVLLESLQDKLFSFLVIDKYNLCSSFIEECKKWTTVVLIEDERRPELLPDIIVNHNIYASEDEYIDASLKKSVEVIAGERYTLLRKQFQTTTKKKVKEMKSLLISIGGTDVKDLTYPLFKMICKLKKTGILNKELKIFLLVKNIGENEQVFLNHDSSLELLSDVSDMAELMDSMDFAITACGSTVYELINRKLPFIGIVIAENQVSIGHMVEDKYSLTVVWDGHLKEKSDLIKEVYLNMCTFLSKVNEFNQLLMNSNIDGYGGIHIVERLQVIKRMSTESD